MDLDLTGANIQPFWDWSGDSHLKKGGSIKFYKIDDSEAPMVELTFEDGFCTNFSASLQEGASSMNGDIVVHARKVEIGGSPVEMQWE